MAPEPAIPPELIDGLLTKTKSNEIQWAVSKEHAYTVELPNCTISLRSSSSTAASPDICFEVATPTGEIVGAVEIDNGHPMYEVIRQLLNSAELNSVSRIKEILKEAAHSVTSRTIHLSGSALTTSTSSATLTTPPPMPPPPTDAQAKEFFQKISGEWFLDFSRGTETLRINEDGTYYTYPPKRMQGAQPGPKYRFTLEQCEPSLGYVEVAKRELDGRVRQLEVLTITPLTMAGYAKHDAHSLRYVWNDWYQCQGKSSRQVHLRALNGEDAKQVYIRAMGMRESPSEISVVRNLDYKPTAADLELDRTLYPQSPFRKEV